MRTRAHTIKNTAFLLGGSFACMILTACVQDMESASSPPPSLTGPVPMAELMSASSSPAPETATIAEPERRLPTTQIISGTGSFVGQPQQPQTSTAPELGTGGITLNFVNADIRDVAKAILGDYLNLNYAVATNAQGMVTIESARPLARADVLPMLEQALRLSELALVANNGLYRIVPVAEASREAGVNAIATGATGQAGFGVEIVPLKYVGVADMARILAPLVPSQGILQTDPTRNMLIIEGTAQERAAMHEAIALFDVNWLSGMSFALYTPQYTDAPRLARELAQIVGGPGSPVGGVIRLVTLDRLNAVLAISAQKEYLEDLQRWVETLDQPSQSVDRRIFVYSVQNGRATDLAEVLTQVLSGSADTAAGAASTSPLARAPEQPFAFAPPPVAPGAPPAGPGAQPQSPPSVLAPAAGAAGVRIGNLANVTVTADERNNALVIMSSPQEYNAIQAALRQLDTVPLQVMLEAAIAEVTLTDDLRFGVQYFYRRGDSRLSLSSSASAAIGSTFPGYSYVFSQGTDIKVVLDALASITRVEVISSPQLLVLNNQVATLQVGDQVPIVTQQAVSTLTTGAPVVNSVQYQSTGVILRVTPRVNQGGMVMMDISQEVSDVAATTTSSIDSPTIKQRKIESTVAVRDNETVALGGLIMEGSTRGRSGIPVLQDIPILGNLFSSQSRDTTKTELMVLITPHVIDSTQKARSVTEELQRKLPALRILFDSAR